MHFDCVRITVAAILCTALAACGGGSDDPVTDFKGVNSGFGRVSTVGNDPVSEDLAEGDDGLDGADGSESVGDTVNDVLQPPPLGCPVDFVTPAPLPVGGPVGVGTTGDGGIGVGATVGKFRGVTIVVNYPDGTELGRAVVDDDSGMVTAYPGRNYAGALQVVALAGDDAAGATYFDPGTQTDLPLLPGFEWRANVSSVRGNIGISIVTDAAAIIADELIASGQTPTDAYRMANEQMTGQINKCVPAAFRIEDITGLPEQRLDSASAVGQLNGDAQGRHVAAIAGLTKLTRNYASGLPADLPTGETRPAIRLSNHLRADIAITGDQDNYLDGVGPAFRATQHTAYPGTAGFFPELVFAMDQIWQTYGPIGAPLLKPASVDYDCLRTKNDGSAPVRERKTLTFNPANNYFSVDDRVVLVGDFRRLANGEFEAVDDFTFVADNNRREKWVAKRTPTYRPSYYRNKKFRPDGSTEQIECYLGI